ncbi:hypothetical protein SAMN05443579_102505 [Variovorax sp. PDC80]|nr:hypothetical protein SAMN05443579_102505 [Variovorax sp. PDC80]
MKPFFSPETSMQVTIQQLGGGALAWQMSLLAALLIAGTLVGWLLYLVIKAGVRDGMSEALRRRRQIRQSDLVADGGANTRD